MQEKENRKITKETISEQKENVFDSDADESLIIVAEGHEHRLSLVTRLNDKSDISHYIEFILDINKAIEREYRGDLDAILAFIRSMVGSGFSVSNLESGSISFELEVDEKSIEKELEKLKQSVYQIIDERGD